MNTDALYYQAREFVEKGNVTGLQKLFASVGDEYQGDVLCALTGEPFANPEMGPYIMAKAVEGAGSSCALTRRSACDVFQNQCDWDVDIAPAVGPLLKMLSDPDAKVRHMAAYATGNVCKRKFDWSAHLQALNRLLSDKDLYVPEAASWALAQMSRRKQDISLAVGKLAKVLAKKGDYNEPRKEASKALLHHARKSAAFRDQVRQVIKTVKLDDQRKEVKRFLDQLGEL